jgi:hypothetical protein
MPITLYRDTTFTLLGLVEGIRRGEVALPEIQRPFVWKASKVRDLLDSMYKGFPVGSLLLWATGAEVQSRAIGQERREVPPRLLIVDGQQRLTSLYAVISGIPVVKKDYSQARIRIAFHPAEERFEVTDAAIERDPEFIADITRIWEDVREVRESYLAGLAAQRGEPLTRREERALEDAIDRVKDLQHYPFKAVELDASLEEERVAEIFVRINSEGVQLNQADFILTLMSVFDEAGRKKLEAFSRAAKAPSRTGASPYNHFFEPAPDQLLRVAVGLAFRRGRLTHVYSLLRGKDMETGQVSLDRRDAQFARLNEAQDYTLDLTNWHEFLHALHHAGFRGARMITSETAVVYTYTLYLIGRRDFGVDRIQLRDVMARWFFMAHTTGRYTSSPESAFEADVNRLRSLPTSDANAFCEALQRQIETVFTSDYWTISLPNRLATSGAKSPARLAYWAALNLLEAEVLFSTAKVSSRLDPAISPVRGVESHHLFPQKHLDDLGIADPTRRNQIANMAFVEWPDNTSIGRQGPADYWPTFSARLSPERLRRHLYWHALPIGWEQLDYDSFLEKRRKKIADVVRAGFATLSAAAGEDGPEVPARTTAELVAAGESMNVEFKSTARWSVRGSQVDKRMEHVILKTVAGFMNAEGGTLLIGVGDDGGVLGLEADYATLGSKGNRDGYELFLTQLFDTNLSGTAGTLVRVSFELVDGKDVARIAVAASARPVFARTAEGREPSEFWARTGNSTRQLLGSDMVDYQRDHWS